MRRRWRWRRCLRPAPWCSPPEHAAAQRLAALEPAAAAAGAVVDRQLQQPGAWRAPRGRCRRPRPARAAGTRAMPAALGTAGRRRRRRHPALPARRGGRRVPARGVRAHRLHRSGRLARGGRRPRCGASRPPCPPDDQPTRCWPRMLLRMLHDVLHTPLPGGTAPGEVPPARKLVELEFHLPSRRARCGRAGAHAAPARARPCRRCSSAR